MERNGNQQRDYKYFLSQKELKFPEKLEDSGWAPLADGGHMKTEQWFSIGSARAG